MAVNRKRLETESKVAVASRLLAAEVEYLTSYGWVPHVVRPASSVKGAIIQWRKHEGMSLCFQSEAIRIQKALDQSFIDAEAF